MRTVLGEQLRYQDIVSTGPGSIPVHPTDVKRHANLGVDLTDQDSQLIQYIREATKAVEQDSGRALVMQTRKLFLDRWPQASPIVAATYEAEDIELRGCPVKGVDSITYTDYSGAVQTWSPSSYQVNTADEPCRVRYVFGGLWPQAIRQEKSIVVTYKAGYVIPFSVDPASDVLTLKGYTPTNGEIWRVSNSGGVLPAPLVCDTDYYVVNASGATCKLSLTSGGSAIDITSAGSGLNFLGELNPIAIQAIYLRVAISYVDREGAEYDQCQRGYWSKIYSLRYEGW